MRRSIPLFLVALLGACGGGGTHTVPQVASGAAGSAPSGPGTLAGFRITVPALSAQVHARNPQYLSTATQSVVITLATVNGAPFTGTQAVTAANLTAANPACSGSPLTCTVAAPAEPGTDVFAVSTYSAQQTSTSPALPTGSLLSTASISLTVVAGQTNTPAVPLVLNGVPAAITAVLPNDPHISGTQSAGYAITGGAHYALTVSAQDASGETIIGDGAPTYAVTSGSGAIALSPTTANTIDVRVKSFSSSPVNLTITPSTGAGTRIELTTVQELWVAETAPNNSLVEAFALTSPPTSVYSDTITSVDRPMGVAIDATGLVWISSNAGRVDAYTPGTNAPIGARSITGLLNPESIAFDNSGNLWVTNLSIPGEVYAYAPGTPPSRIDAATIIGLDYPTALAIDNANNVWVNEFDPFTNLSIVEAFLPGSTTPIGPDTISNGISEPDALAFDGAGNLWVSNRGSNQVTAYPAGTTTPRSAEALTSGISIPQGLAFDGSGHLWVANYGAYQVTEYSPGTNAPIGANTITTSAGAYGVAIAP